jgi:hypothetical protein
MRSAGRDFYRIVTIKLPEPSSKWGITAQLRLTQRYPGCFDERQAFVPSALRRVSIMSFEEALAAASRDEGFKATVYAMNTLLIHKGIYTQEEFQTLFVEWVEKEQRRKAPAVHRAESSSAFSA